MIGWALRWLLLWCGLAMVCVAVVDRARWSQPAAGADPAIAASPAPQTASVSGAAVNTLVYQADRRGHIMLDAVVNGAPVRFLLDTGASLVTLTPSDAQAAGVSPGPFDFNARASTANGVVRMAPVTLREIRLGQLSLDDVPAAVIENLNVSLLGMSFLRRLQSYEMRDGRLTITW